MKSTNLLKLNIYMYNNTSNACVYLWFLQQQKKIEKLFAQRLDDLANDLEKAVSELETKCQDVRSSLIATMNFYGEDRISTSSIADFFINLNNFVKQLDRAEADSTRMKIAREGVGKHL